MTLLDAAYALDELAAGRAPERSRVLTGALTLKSWCAKRPGDRDALDAAAGLEVLATGGALDLSEAGRARVGELANVVRQAALRE